MLVVFRQNRNDTFLPVRCKRASASLAALISTTGGALFILLFANLVRYVAVKNALEQAAEKTARCITPTDAECSQTTEPLSQTEYDWYRTAVARNESKWADRYDYQASLTAQTWKAQYSAYEIHKVQAPLLRWTESLIPEKTFRAVLNKFEHRRYALRADLQVHSVGFTPLAYPSFPEFDPTFEDAAKNQSPAAWVPRALNAAGDVRHGSHAIVLPFQPAKVFPDTEIDRNQKMEFLSEIYEVPLLPEDQQTCVTPANTPCGVSYAAGGNDDWYRKAYIAVKAFAQITRLRGSPDVKWAGSPTIPAGTPDGWGLQVETASAAEYAAWKVARDNALSNGLSEPELPHVDCLGGRDWQNINKTDNFHLVLRGAIRRDSKNSTDREVNAACPNGVVNHWNLSVERGGAYRIRGWLKVRSGDVTAKVIYQTYYDSYIPLPGHDRDIEHCEESGTLSPTHQDPPKDCSSCGSRFKNSPGVSYTELGCSINTIVEPLCIDDSTAAQDTTVFPSAGGTCGSAVQALVCDANWTPSVEPNCNKGQLAASNQIICGWQADATPVTTVQTPTVPANCPLSTSAPKTALCGNGLAELTYRSDGNYGQASDCPAAAGIIASEESKVQSLHAATANTGVVLPDFQAANMSFTPAAEFSPVRWSESFAATDEFGNPISDSAAIRLVQRTRGNAIPIYKHIDTKWVPSWMTFGFTDSQIAALESLGRIDVHLETEHPTFVVDVYPFSRRPEFEIPDFLPSEAKGSQCSGAYAPLSDRLREYAAHSIPAASDQSVAVDFSSTYVDSIQVSSLNGCQAEQSFNLTLPACTKLTSISSDEAECGPGEYLGRYSSSTAPNGPPACDHLAGTKCYSEAVLNNSQELSPDITVDLEQAKARGFSELDRHMPGTSQNCSESGCARVDIDSTTPLSKINLQYQMPLTFPLDLILGRSSLAVVTTKEETRESSVIGRFGNRSSGSE